MTVLIIWASLLAQLVKNLPAVQETLFQSLGQENCLEKEMATHFSILAWRFLWTEEHAVVLVLGLSCSVACGILVAQPGIKPVSPALQGRFLTSRPPAGVPEPLIFFKKENLPHGT